MSTLEFLQENPMLWDIKLTDFRRTDKKNKIWDEQSKRLDKTPEYLKGWFKSLRDIYTRLDKKKSGDVKYTNFDILQNVRQILKNVSRQRE